MRSSGCAQDGSFNPFLSWVGEYKDPVPIACGITEILEDRFCPASPIDDDSRVDVVVSHRFWQDNIEFVASDHILDFPAVMGIITERI
jgi:hypothetical protein